jgi:quinol monooxygenase YgiN
MLVIAGTIKLDPAKRSQAEAAFEIMRAATLEEPGCIEYQAYLDRSDGGTFFMFEKWQDQAALNAHFASAHMAEFGKALGAAGVTGGEIVKYEVSKEGPAM